MRRAAILTTLAVSSLLTACQSQPPRAASATPSALDIMEKVAVAANRCWMKSGDPVFRGYSMAPELNSFSGRPRILIVRASGHDIRPLLVVQAEGRPARLDAFGPMLDEAAGARIRADITRWARGGREC
jgi:hypothetical protein